MTTPHAITPEELEAMTALHLALESGTLPVTPDTDPAPWEFSPEELR